MTKKKKKSGFDRFIDGVEKAGNALPSPFVLFIYLCLIILVLSFVLSKLGVGVEFTSAARDGAEMETEFVSVVNLLSKEEIAKTLTNFVPTFIDFPPLGLVLIMMMGISFIEHTGLVNAAMRKTLMGAPQYMVTLLIAFVGVNSNIASDAGPIFSASIAASLFHSLGRSPAVGATLGFAAASGGFTANLFVAGTDALLSGITQSVTEGMGIDAVTHPLMNYYFMATATFFITIAITLVAEKYLLPKHDYERVGEIDLEAHKVTDLEKKGLRRSGFALLAYIVLIVALTVPQNSLFRSEDGAILPKSPLISSIVPILFFMFVLIGYVYGKTVGTIKSEKDVFALFRQGISSALTFLVIALPASQFISLFNRSKITTVLAVKGANFLGGLNLGTIPLLLVFIFLVTLVNILMTSGSSKWLILAPVFVPMLAFLGLSPAAAQVAYRIGDSSTNIISPINSTLAVVLGIMQNYSKDGDEEIGIGTVISYTLPYSIAILLSLSVLLVIWILLGLPLGPGAGIYL